MTSASASTSTIAIRARTRTRIVIGVVIIAVTFAAHVLNSGSCSCSHRSGFGLLLLRAGPAEAVVDGEALVVQRRGRHHQQVAQLGALQPGDAGRQGGVGHEDGRARLAPQAAGRADPRRQAGSVAADVALTDLRHAVAVELTEAVSRGAEDSRGIVRVVAVRALIAHRQLASRAAAFLAVLLARQRRRGSRARRFSGTLFKKTRCVSIGKAKRAAPWPS